LQGNTISAAHQQVLQSSLRELQLGLSSRIFRSRNQTLSP
jgi:hypothetical protein